MRVHEKIKVFRIPGHNSTAKVHSESRRLVSFALYFSNDTGWAHQTDIQPNSTFLNCSLMGQRLGPTITESIMFCFDCVNATLLDTGIENATLFSTKMTSKKTESIAWGDAGKGQLTPIAIHTETDNFQCVCVCVCVCGVPSSRYYFIRCEIIYGSWGRVASPSPRRRPLSSDTSRHHRIDQSDAHETSHPPTHPLPLHPNPNPPPPTRRLICIRFMKMNSLVGGAYWSAF